MQLEKSGLVELDTEVISCLRANEFFDYKLLDFKGHDIEKSKAGFAKINKDNILHIPEVFESDNGLSTQIGAFDLLIYLKSKIYNERVYHGQSLENIAKFMGRNVKTIENWANRGVELGLFSFCNDQPFTIVRNDIKQEPATI